MNACRDQHPELRIQYAASAREAAEDADAVVIVTEWQEFAELDLAELAALMARPVLIDGRNLYSPELAAAAGFDYTGVGRPHPGVPKKNAAVPSMNS
jgi:UDPglucose 6-dehydrogenase